MEKLKKTANLAKFLAIAYLFVSLPGCPFFCGKQGPGTTYRLPQIALDFVPYTGSETLKFKNASGHITTFTGVRSNDLHHVFEECVECCHSNDLAESQYFTFTGDDPPLEFVIQLYENHSEWEGSSTNFTLGIRQTLQTAVALDNFYNPCGERNSHISCLDSLSLNGVTYHEVMAMNLTGQEGNPDIVADSAWYTRANGLIKFNLTDGKTWELMP